MPKKEEIINITAKLFAEKGYNLSMSEIAKAVKLKAPSLYSHFENKDQIIEMVVQREIDAYYKSLDAKIRKVAKKNCSEQLEEIYHFILDYFKQEGRLRSCKYVCLVCNNDLMNKFKYENFEKNKSYMVALKNLLQRGIDSGEIKASVGDDQVFLYFAMIQGVLDIILVSQNGSFDVDQFAKNIWNAYWDGIKC